MALVVLGIDINTIPARREHELESNTIETIGIEVRLVGKEVAVERTLRGDGIIEAVKTKSSLTEEGLLGHVACPVRLWEIRDGVTEVALIGVTGDHLEALGESREGGVVCVGVQKIVSGRMLAVRIEVSGTS
jgi:hypothetical protein